MWLKFGILIIAICAINVNTIEFTYDGYKVYEIEQTSVGVSDFLFTLASNNENLDFWKLNKVVGDKARVSVAPNYQNDFEQILNDSEIQFNEFIDNLERPILEERVQQLLRGNKKDVTSKYYRHDEINDYLDQLSKSHSKFVKVQTVGKSYQGRDLKTITITNGDFSSTKKTIFLDGGIHAREWASPATVLYIINQLVENAAAHQDVLKTLTWVVLPVINADGYEYTHTNQRMWRKTRSINQGCYGTDGNRNFDFHWGEVGASNQPCSDTYRGPKAFSEVETAIVKTELTKLRGACKFYLTLHSYGNYMLYPWGWTNALPATWRDLDDVASVGADAIRKATGTKYTVGSSTNVLYAAAGGSDDYAFGALQIPIAITMELPGGGSGGFDPPPSSIKRIVEESWIGIKAMAKRVDEKYRV